MIHFIRYAKVYFLLSAIVIGVGLFTIFTRGFELSIDFTGGSMIEYAFSKDTKAADIEKVFKESKIEVSAVTPEGPRRFIIKAAPLSEVQEATLRKTLGAQQLRFDSVTPIFCF